MTLDFDKINVLQKISHHTSDVTTCDFGSNFNLATGSGDKSVCIWEWKPGLGYVDTTYSPLLGHKYNVTWVKFSPQGSLLASASVDGSTNIWNVKTGECIATFIHKGNNGVRSCSFSSKNVIATSGDDGTVCLWDLVNQTLIKCVECHEETVYGVDFTPDSGFLASGDTSGQLKIWHVNTFNAPLSITCDAHDLGILGLEFMNAFEQNSNGKFMDAVYKLVTCGNDHLVKLWIVSVSEVKDGSQVKGTVELIRTFLGHSSAVTNVHFNAAGNLIVSSSLDKTSRLWDVSSQRCIKVLEEHSRYVNCCAFSRDQSLLATGSNDKTCIVWDLTGTISIDSVLTSSNSSQVSSAKNREANVVKIAEMSGKHIKLWQRLDCNSTNSFNSCDFICKGDDQLLAAAGRNKSIYLWKKVEDRFRELDVSPLEGHTYPINQVEFSSDGQFLASCSLDGTAIIWNVETGLIYKSGFKLSSGGLRAVRFSPDCRLFATGGDDETISVYRTNSCEILSTLSDHTESISCIAFSVDSAYYVSGCAGGYLRCWCAVPVSNICIGFVENAHDLGVTSCDFAAVNNRILSDGDQTYLLATCGNDSFVKFWQIRVIDELNVKITNNGLLSGHGGNVTCVRFSPGLAEVAASTASDKTCRIWDVGTCDCLHVIEQQDIILTSCSFTADASYLATSSLDKSILIWELPKDIAFHNFIATRTSQNKKEVLERTSTIAAVDHSQIEYNLMDLESATPQELTCPITHQLMMEPVTCVDGYTYERNAIESWFARGKETSPMTNTIVPSTDLTPNDRVKQAIGEFLNR